MKRQINKEEYLGVVASGLIVVGLFLFFISILFIFNEFYGAKSFCKGVGGEYSFNLKEVKHFCSEKEIVGFSNGWNYADFYKDFSEIRINIP